MDSMDLYGEGIRVAEELDKARTAHFEMLLRLNEAEAKMTMARAITETAIVEKAGGDKALGSNAEARKRALAAALSMDDGYQGFVADVDSLRIAAKEQEAQVLAWRDHLGIVKATLYSYSSIGAE